MNKQAINLEEVAAAIENALNGTAVSPYPELVLATDEYYFKVVTQGFHLDTLADVDQKKNFIPVIISQMTGEFNPISPRVVDESLTISVVLYFPLSKKQDFFALQRSLQAWTGARFTWGEETGSCISNILPATYSEVDKGSVLAYEQFVSDVFHRPLDIDIAYGLMEFNLFLNKAAALGSDNEYHDMLFGNEFQVTLRSVGNPAWFHDKVITTGVAFGVQTSSSAQQALGDGKTFGLAETSTATYSFTAMLPRRSIMRPDQAHCWQTMLEKICRNELQGEAFVLALISDSLQPAFNVQVEVYVTSATAVIEKGSIVAINFVFAQHLQL